MAVFQGRYHWDGTRRDNLDPVAWFSGSYDLQIFALEEGATDRVERMKTHICLFSRTGDGQSMNAQPDKFAKKICHDFGLDIDRILWIEDLLTQKNRYEVLVLTRTGKLGETFFYKSERRYPHPWEMHALLSELDKVAEDH